MYFRKIVRGAEDRAHDAFAQDGTQDVGADLLGLVRLRHAGRRGRRRKRLA